jgi:Tat protein secretion system quality control protein TatD with DNase activity
MSNTAFIFNDKEYAFETFDDEIVVLNLLSGTYYAVGETGLDIWDALVRSSPLQEIIRACVGRYGVAEDVVAADLRALVSGLAGERIVLETDASPGPVSLTPRKTTNGYRAPTIQKHADLEDLLTLDPIHDVDPERGWPHY